MYKRKQMSIFSGFKYTIITFELTHAHTVEMQTSNSVGLVVPEFFLTIITNFAIVISIINTSERERKSAATKPQIFNFAFHVQPSFICHTSMCDIFCDFHIKMTKTKAKQRRK